MRDLQVIKNEIIAIVSDKELTASAKLWIDSSVHLLSAADKVLNLIVAAIIVLFEIAKASLSTVKSYPVVITALEVSNPVVATVVTKVVVPVVDTVVVPVVTKVREVSEVLAPVVANVAAKIAVVSGGVASFIDVIKPAAEVVKVFFVNRPLVVAVAVALVALTN